MLKQPVGFVKLTNVAIVKYKVAGKKLEIACYKNKVLDWRKGLEKHLVEVLQVEEIFTNAVQGELANKKLLQELFPNKNKSEIIAIILDKGEMQVSQKEREALQENTFKDIVNIISKKIVHPKSKRLFSTESIKAALKEVNFNQTISKTSKQQAQDGIRLLEKYYCIERIGMLVSLKFNDNSDFENLEKLIYFQVEKKKENEAQIIINPNIYKELDKHLQEELKGKFEVVILDNAYFNSQSQNIDIGLETSLQRKENVDLPSQHIHENDKKATNHASLTMKEDPVEKEVKKVVMGFDAMQVKMQESKEKGEDKFCATCLGISFPNLKDYKDHIKADWHKFNLKRKMNKEEPLGDIAFRDFIVMQDFVKK
jgi:ribosome maturation protein SDO1